MSPLHGLRLNCLLAPLTTAAIGAAAVLLTWRWHGEAVRHAQEDAHIAALSGLARLVESDAAPALGAWLPAHPGWTGMAQVQVRNEAVIVLGTAGDTPARREASPQVMQAYRGPRHWMDGRLAAYAVPCLPQSGASSVLIAWRAPETPVAIWPWLGLAGGVLALGGGLGIYLVVRVYRPVVWFQRAAEAAAQGGAVPADAPAGPETESLRSSIATLIAQRRHTDGDDHA